MISFDFSGQDPAFQQQLRAAGFAPFNGGGASPFTPQFARFAPSPQGGATPQFSVGPGVDAPGTNDSGFGGFGQHAGAVDQDLGSFLGHANMAFGLATNPFGFAMDIGQMALGAPTVGNTLGVPSLADIFGKIGNPAGYEPSFATPLEAITAHGDGAVGIGLGYDATDHYGGEHSPDAGLGFGAGSTNGGYGVSDVQGGGEESGVDGGMGGDNDTGPGDDGGADNDDGSGQPGDDY